MTMLRVQKDCEGLNIKLCWVLLSFFNVLLNAKVCIRSKYWIISWFRFPLDNIKHYNYVRLSKNHAYLLTYILYICHLSKEIWERKHLPEFQRFFQKIHKICYCPFFFFFSLQTPADPQGKKAGLIMMIIVLNKVADCLLPFVIILGKYVALTSVRSFQY